MQRQDTSTTAPTGGVALCGTTGCDGQLCAWCEPEKKSREGYAPDTAPPVAPPPPNGPPKGWPAFCRCAVPHIRLTAGVRSCVTCDLVVGPETFARAALSALPSVPSVAPMSHPDRLHAELLEDHKHLARKVLEVLRAQRAYFTSRAHADLIHAKALEGQLRSLATTAQDRTR